MGLVKFIAAAAVAIGFVPVASAQNLQLNQAPAVFETVTAQWVVDLFSDTDLTATIVDQAADRDTIQVMAPGGAVFYIAVRSCDGATPKNCRMLQTFALFDGTGVTLNQINTMVRDNFLVGYAFLNTDGNGILVTKITLSGGVTDGNVFSEMGAYLRDIDKLISAIESGPIAAVTFDKVEQSAGAGSSKILNNADVTGDYVVNAVGPNAPKFLTDEFSVFVD